MKVTPVVIALIALFESGNSQTCQNTVQPGTDCSSSPNCCPTGQKCFRKNQYWAGCLETCTAGMIDEYDNLAWECTVVAAAGGGGGGGSSGGVPQDCATLAQTSGSKISGEGFATKHGKLTLKGVQIVNEAGQAVQLQGMSSHGIHWFESCYNKEAIQFLVQNWGINLFRAAMYIGEGGYNTDPAKNKKMVQDIVQWCEELGIYVIIDWHVLSPGDPNAWLTSEGASTGTAINFWKEMATLYKGKKHILYEIANEPNGVSWEKVKAYHDAVIGEIRTIDAETIILAGTTNWSQDIHLAAANPVAKPYNVMYSFHFYAGTHLSLLSRVKDYKTKIPIFVTEWGTSEASGNGGPYLPQTQQFLDAFSSDGVLLSWAQWSFADKDEVSAALKPGSCGTKSWDATTCSGSFVKLSIQRARTVSGGGNIQPSTQPTNNGGSGDTSPTPQPTDVNDGVLPSTPSKSSTMFVAPLGVALSGVFSLIRLV